MQLTQVYLDPDQKRALGSKAKARGVKVSEVIREAVDTYLAGVSSDDLRLLDRASAQAARDFAEMGRKLDEINAKLDAAFRQIEAMRRKAAA